MINWLKRLYLRIGIHTAPQGTLLYLVHLSAARFYSRLLGLDGRPGLEKKPGAKLSAAPRFPYWYKIVGPHAAIAERRRRPWHHFRGPFGPGEHVIYDLEIAIEQGGARGLALVFFMGMGDYIFATPLLAALRALYPTLPIYGYVSKNFDENNSPLVGTLMQHNPDIDEVHYYTGTPSLGHWKNYNFKEVYALAPKDFLVLPVVYEDTAVVRHRVFTLFETFSLPRPKTLPLPLVHLPEAPAAPVARLLAEIRQRYEALDRRGIVFLQVDARSSNYSYPYVDELVDDLSRQGYLVISASKIRAPHDTCVALDLKQFSIVDSIYLLQLLKTHYKERVFLLTVTSVFWSISAALELPNIGMQHFRNERVNAVWYPNTYIIAHHDYPCIPQDRLFCADEGDYDLNIHRHVVFKPEFVMHCFYTAIGHDNIERSAVSREDDAQHQAVVLSRADVAVGA